MQEIEKLKANIKKLEELSSKLKSVLKEINYSLRGQSGQRKTNNRSYIRNTD